MKIGFNITEKRGEGGINLCVSYIKRPLNRPLVYGDNTEFCSEAKPACYFNSQ